MIQRPEKEKIEQKMVSWLKERPKKIVKRNPNKATLQYNHWSGTSKKSWHNDFLPKFYLKENAFIWKQKSVGPDLLATSFSGKNRPQNPTCCWLSLTWYTINCMEQILYSSALTTLAMLRHTIPLLLSTRNGSKSSRSTIKFH